MTTPTAVIRRERIWAREGFKYLPNYEMEITAEFTCDDEGNTEDGNVWVKFDTPADIAAFGRALIKTAEKLLIEDDNREKSTPVTED